MSENARLQAIRAVREELAALGIDPFGVQIDRIITPTEGMIQGRPTILAGTNNYLGMTFDPSCIAAAREALEHAGTGTTGSRMANGSYADHRELELDLARFYNKRDGIVFSTGYQANLGMISALAGPGDNVLIDADSHASIYDGCKLSGANIIRFRHNDPADLEKRLRRLGDDAAKAVIVIEGVYSMLGDRAPLADFVRVKKAFGATLLVDEAHSMGVLGATGQGLVEELGVLDDVDYVVGTFSKSLGNTGGFCVSNAEEMDVLRYASRPYVFTASLAPATIAATRQALRVLAAASDKRERLRANAERLHAGLAALGFELGAPPNAVVAVLVGEKLEALRFWDHLLKNGVYVNLMVPPATPGTSSLLRCSVSAAHTPEQIDAICAAFASWPGARQHAHVA
ncbi:serine palmitoyltransferase [Luteibacter aegosomatissinici]|uniref:serine palmitoyltransferase n=1 Tax=Luteibacter aegosomatissinici TaxID=2911539 RepID=UPI001FF7ABC1|nr:aminotransferase class I/II-fold pyridoxal phosphate-dependent enzyme [Luteibacter aegosomatissinici]UPG96515.1 aminotransferase class I/II-fold pyridoxal phosphate-dependent enzyme [Luteibacter aegosomatissinici]